MTFSIRFIVIGHFFHPKSYRICIRGDAARSTKSIHFVHAPYNGATRARCSLDETYYVCSTAFLPLGRTRAPETPLARRKVLILHTRPPPTPLGHAARSTKRTSAPSGPCRPACLQAQVVSLQPFLRDSDPARTAWRGQEKLPANKRGFVVTRAG